MVVSSRLSASPRTALPEKSLELLTMIRPTSSSPAGVAFRRVARRLATAANHDKNPGLFPRSGCTVATSVPAAVSSREASGGDWRSRPPFPPGISGIGPAVSFSVSVVSGRGGDGSLEGHLSVSERRLPVCRAWSRASRLLTALSRRRWSR